MRRGDVDYVVFCFARDKAALIYAHGFTADLLAELVHDGLATAKPGTVRAGGRPIEVTRIKITDAGRRALG
jgi:hypothetical protein